MNDLRLDEADVTVWQTGALTTSDWVQSFDLPTTEADGSAPTAETGLSAALATLEAREYLSLFGVAEDAALLASVADEIGDRCSATRARLIVADVASRRGDVASALAIEQELLGYSKEWPLLNRRVKTLISTTCDRLGERAEALRWIRSAMESWPDGQGPAWRAEALMVFVVATVSRSGFDADLVYHAAEEVRSACPLPMYVSTVANFGEVAGECGELPVAIDFADCAEALVHRHPEIAAPLTFDSIASVRLVAGEVAGAQALLEEGLRLEETMGCSDVCGDPWLTMAGVRFAAGDPSGAWAMIEHPRRFAWAARSSWTQTRDLRLRSQILAALGRWEEAYGSLEAHLGAYQTLRSVEGDREAAESETAQAMKEERRRARQFEQLALTDPLTGLANRRKVDRWMDDLDQTLSNSSRGGGLAVAILDVDHFKNINDRFSHDTGDRVLRKLASIVSTSSSHLIHPPDLVARLGGEEFVIIWTAIDRRAAQASAEIVLDALRRTDFADVGLNIPVTASIGLAYDPDLTSARALLKTADARLYEAKRQGRNRFIGHDVQLAFSDTTDMPAD